MRSLKTVTQLTTKDGSLTTDDKQAAEVLCDYHYFKEVFTKEIDCRDKPTMRSTFGINDRIVFSEELVLVRLQRLKPNKSPGLDGIHPMLLKSCAHQLAKPLSSLIYQASFDDGQLSSDWKLTNISPIFKKGPKSDPGNYRPISLTSVPCKIIEGILRDHLLDHLDTTHIISVKQHGFVRGRSCLTNLLETLEEWTSALDEGHGIDAIYLDYWKALDTVPHKRLIMRLQNFGIDRSLLNWLKDFLTLRKMRVGINGSFSSWADVLGGDPQDSVLGPILFLIYVNDIADLMSNSIRLFADDTKIWKK